VAQPKRNRQETHCGKMCRYELRRPGGIRTSHKLAETVRIWLLEERRALQFADPQLECLDSKPKVNRARYYDGMIILEMQSLLQACAQLHFRTRLYSDLSRPLLATRHLHRNGVFTRCQLESGRAVADKLAIHQHVCASGI
jgi:hypothetical protein